MGVGERAVATDVNFHDDMVWITLSDRRVIGMPLDFFPWLEHATPQQRAYYTINPISIYWPDLEDGIDIEALIKGNWATPRG
jgi:hypothetical protein